MNDINIKEEFKKKYYVTLLLSAIAMIIVTVLLVHVYSPVAIQWLTSSGFVPSATASRVMGRVAVGIWPVVIYVICYKIYEARFAKAHVASLARQDLDV